jgi:hypothetical protein
MSLQPPRSDDFTANQEVRWILALLLAGPALPILTGADSVALDPDVYWQIEAGRWIVEHGRLPDTDPFSLHGQGQPWVDYSWLFQLLIYGCWHALGYAGLVLYTLVMLALIAAALTSLLLKIQPNLTVVALSVFLAMQGLTRISTPRPWLLSILFFILEVDILLTAGRTGRLRLLWLLPPLFVLWASIHIQFIVGGVVLGLALLASACRALLEHPRFRGMEIARWVDVSATLPLSPLLAVAVVCGLATLLNPYHVGVYEAAIALLRDRRLWGVLGELLSMRFRDYSEWIVLGATLAAVFCIGWRRRMDLFLILLLGLGIWTSFRSRRDLWLVLIAALVIVNQALRPGPDAAPWRPGKLRWAAIVAGAGVALSVVSALTVFPEALERPMKGAYPDAACAYVLAQRCPGPLFNHYDWGGYLIWRLHDADPPLPVGMDGRAMIYGEERILEQNECWLGEPEWEDNPDLKAANLVIARRDMALTSLLKSRGAFRVAYEDQVAVVFVRREPR